MEEDTTIRPFRQSETIIDPLTELARKGARRMLAEALKAEAGAFVARFAGEQMEDGRQRIVRRAREAPFTALSQLAHKPRERVQAQWRMILA